MNNNKYPGCIEAIRQARARKNSFIDSSFELLLSNLSESSIKQHDKHLSDWWNYCDSKNIDPLKTDISIILDYFGKKLYVDGVEPDDLKQICPSLFLIATDELLERVYLTSFLYGTFDKKLIIDEDSINKQNNTAGQENSKLSLIDKGKKQYLSKVSILKKNNYSKETTINNKLPVLMKNNSIIKSGNSQIAVNQQMKILVLISDNEFKVIPFDLTKNQKCNIHDVLGRAGIPVNNKTKILFLTNSKLNYNFIVDCCASTNENNSIKTKNAISKPSRNSIETSNVIVNPSNNLFETNAPSTLASKSIFNQSNNPTGTKNPSIVDNNLTTTYDTISYPSNNSTGADNPSTIANNTIETNDTILNPSNNSTGANNPSTIANNTIETNDTILNPSNDSTGENNSTTIANSLTETNNTIFNQSNNSTGDNDTILNPSNDSTGTNPFIVDDKSTVAHDAIINPSNSSTETKNPSTVDNNSAVINNTITDPPTSSTNNSEIYKLPLKLIVNQQKSIIKQQVKILIIIPNCKQKIITFNLPRKKYYVNDLLLQGGVTIDDETEVSLVNHPPLINLNYIVECDSTNLMIESVEVNGLVNKSSNELLIDSTVFEYPCKIITDLKTTLIEPKIKLLIIMPNDQKKLIIFDIPTKKTCINDLLIKAGIQLNNNTKVSIIEDYPGLNVYYIVRYKSNNIVDSKESIVKLKNPVGEVTDSMVDSKDSIVKLKDPIVDSKDSIVKLINPIVEPQDPIVERPLEKNTTDTSNHTQDNNNTTNASVLYHSSDQQPTVQHTDPNVEPINSIAEPQDPIVEPQEPIVEPPLEENVTDTSNHTQDNNITTNASVLYQSSDQQHTVQHTDPNVEPTDSFVEPQDQIFEPPLEENTTDTSNHTQDNNITTNASVPYQSSSNQQHTELIDQIHNNNNLNIDNQIIIDTNEYNLKRKSTEELILNQTKKQKSLNSTKPHYSNLVGDESSSEVQLISVHVGFLIELECFTIKTGLYECVPNHPVTIDLNGLSLKLPRQDHKQVFVDININYYEIHEVEIHTRPKMPVLFIYTNTTAALRIKNALHIQDKNLPIDSQSNICRMHKRITLLLKNINDKLIKKLEKLFSPICPYKVISKKQALINLQ
ncbi:putative uncharacterized protein DDB_G0282133 [Aphidius gifuensis]|uniref:putative uncharacterized protein DDB_G0282133 n=1 Tax=Aphidius gifuensis TaxID=684658 RepID=UPI001CDB82DA|nr:putative uncharacterized protein DDB_G0282133 [Aphidius gifuensis]